MLRAVPKGDKSYDDLYKAHYARIQRLCRLLLRDAYEAEEVQQEIFLKMLRQYRSPSHPTDWRSWLTRVAINACHDRRRSAWWKWFRSSNDNHRETDYPSLDRTPEQEALGREERNRIWQFFRELSARQQEVFVLRYLEEWPTEEVARLLGLSVGSVKTHLFRAVRHLRKALGDRS